MRIDILIPTRKRVDRLKQVLESIEKTKSGKIYALPHIYWDNEDYDLMVQTNLDWEIEKRNYVGFPNSSANLSQMWNMLAEHSIDSQTLTTDILMHAGDDIIFKTKDWDLMVVEEFEKCKDKILLVYGDDGIQGEKLATHGFYSRKATEVIGYFLPPYFAANYNDTWWTEVYRDIGRLKYLPDMNIEHMHFSKHPELMDETYNLAIDKRYEKSTEVWNSKKDERERDKVKLKKYIAREV